MATNTETALAEVSSDSLGNVKEKKKKTSTNINTGSAVPQVLCFPDCSLHFSCFQTGEPCLLLRLKAQSEPRHPILAPSRAWLLQQLIAQPSSPARESEGLQASEKQTRCSPTAPNAVLFRSTVLFF